MTMVNNRRPSKDEGCCSVHFLKYVLFIFNFIFYLAGLAIIGIGLWTLFFKSSYVSLLATKTFEATTYILIGAGILVLFVGILGCVGVLKENRCCLLLFTFLLLLIFLVEAVAGILAYIYSEQIGNELKRNLNQTIAQHYSEDDVISSAIQKLHIEHQCCGAVNFMDWRKSKWYEKINTEKLVGERGGKNLFVPDFCCRTPSEFCGERDHPSNIHYDGCIESLRDEIREHQIIVGAIALGISTVQIFGMVLSCCLYVKLKDFEYVKGRRHYGY